MKQRKFLQSYLHVLEGLEPLLPFYLPYRRLFKTLKVLTQSGEDIELQAEKASQALTYAAEVVNNFQETLKTQKQDLQKAVSDYRKYAALATTEKETAQALIDEIKRISRRDRILQWIGAIVIGVGIFLLGYFIG